MRERFAYELDSLFALLDERIGVCPNLTVKDVTENIDKAITRSREPSAMDVISLILFDINPTIVGMKVKIEAQVLPPSFVFPIVLYDSHGGNTAREIEEERKKDVRKV